MDTVESVRFQTISTKTQNGYQYSHTQHEENEDISSSNVNEDIEQDYSCAKIQAHDLEHYSKCQIDVSSSRQDSQIDVCRNVINQIIEDGGQTHWISSRLVTCFSDRKVKFSQILAEYKSDILPLIIQEYGSFCQSEKKMISLVNHLFCGLHLIVSLAHQAKITLLLWDNMIFGKQLEGVGAQSFRYIGSTELESGTVRSIRTLCNAFQTPDNAIDSKLVEFKTFLTSKGEFDVLHFSPSSVNRIDCLFYNAAGLYSIYNDLLQFTSGCSENMSLLENVAADVKVRQFRAGCRALGLFFKFVIEPFWKAFTLNGDLLKMNIRYQVLIGKLKKLHRDGKSLVDGNVCLFDDIGVEGDPVLDKLTMSLDEGTYELAVQAVELLSFSFLKVCRQMLPIELEALGDIEGRDDLVPKMDDHHKQSLNITLNSQKAKSNAACFALEGMFVSKRNRSWKWLSLLDKDRTVSVLKTLKQAFKQNKVLNGRRRRKVFVRSTVQSTKNENMAVDKVMPVQLRPVKEMSWKVIAMAKITSKKDHRSQSLRRSVKKPVQVDPEPKHQVDPEPRHQVDPEPRHQVDPEPRLEVEKAILLSSANQCTIQGTPLRGVLDQLNSVSWSHMGVQENVNMEHYLTEKLKPYGGLWKKVKDVDKKVAMLHEKDRYDALVCQLLFHRFVLGLSSEHGFFKTSHAGRRLNLSELVDNLKCFLLPKIGHRFQCLLPLNSTHSGK